MSNFSCSSDFCLSRIKRQIICVGSDRATEKFVNFSLAVLQTSYLMSPHLVAEFQNSAKLGLVLGVIFRLIYPDDCKPRLSHR